MTEESFFEANLDSLERDGLASSCTLEALKKISSSRLSFDPSTGWLFSDPSSGANILLHSKRYPEMEASRQIKRWLDEGGGRPSRLVVVLGAAGLHHVKAVADVLPDGASIFVIEPLPEILHVALSKWRLEKLARPSVRVRFVSHLDQPLLLEEFRSELRALPRLDVSVYAHPASARVAPALYKAIEKGMEEKLRFEALNRETLARFSRVWTLNALRNSPSLLDSLPFASLKGVFSGCSAIVVGAGPSLDSSLGLLKELRSKFLIVAAGTALKPLLKAGVEPDFAVAVDSDPKTLKQYEGLDLKGVRLAACLNVDPALPALFKGRLVFFSANLSAPLNAWLESLELLPERLSVGGTVAVSAVDFARFLGCRRIAMCGVDLAMAATGETHSAGSVYSGAKASEELVQVPGNWGRQVMTTRQFAAYIGLVGNFAFDLKRRWGVELFNANDFGALISGAIPLSPAKGLSSLAVALPENSRRNVEKLFSSFSCAGVDRSLASLEKSVAWLENLASAEASALALHAKGGAADAAFSSLEELLRSGKGAASLLGALLNEEALAFVADGVPDVVKLHSSVGAAASDLASALRSSLAGANVSAKR